MQIKRDEIISSLKSQLEGLELGRAELAEVGTVISVADGIAHIRGLEDCMAFEVLELPHPKPPPTRRPTRPGCASCQPRSP